MDIKERVRTELMEDSISRTMKGLSDLEKKFNSLSEKLWMIKTTGEKLSLETLKELTDMKTMIFSLRLDLEMSKEA